jgi:peptide/nickel transport system substrate-binding protein
MPGGRIVYVQKTEPKTLNTLIVTDSASKEVIQRLMADLVHINRETQQTEPALAKSWQVSADHRRYTLTLRRGLRFSDGVPCTADDVVFSYQCYLDERLHSSQRDLLILDGQPIRVSKLDDSRVVFELPRPYAVGERLFDSFYILPKHLLEPAYREGRLGEIWSLGAAPRQIAGLGPFRLKQMVPGQRMILERNPYYWKVDSAGHRLPYLEELVFEFAGSEDLQVLRFRAGESDLLNRISGPNYAALLRDAGSRGLHMVDAGPGLEFHFLFFNLGDLPAGVSPDVRRHQEFFRLLAFRSAVNDAIDRQSLARLAFQGYAAPLTSPVPAGNRNWIDSKLAQVACSPGKARQILKDAHFRWDSSGRLLSPSGRPVEFTIAVSSTSAERIRMATLIQDDLSKIGMKVEVATLEFRSLLDRLQRTRDFDAAIVPMGESDADPNVDLPIWLSSGANHVWNPLQKSPATPWEAEIDRLMRQQLVTPAYVERKRLFDRVQELVMANLPVIPLVSPHILVGARAGLANFRPAVLEHYTLWNADELYWQAGASGARR